MYIYPYKKLTVLNKEVATDIITYVKVTKNNLEMN